MNIEGLDKKEFVIAVRWVVDANYMISDGIEQYLENLREIGSAEVTDIELRDKEDTK